MNGERATRPACILLVEDDQGFREAAVGTLSGAGFKIIVAADYLAALTALESGEPIHLLLTDIVMENGVNGFALARMARMRRKEIKLLYMTSYDIPTYEALGRVLRKPLRDGELVSAVASVIGVRGV